jgi:hypothetical protein
MMVQQTRERTRLIRGAGSLAGLLRANTQQHQQHQQHQQADADEPSSSASSVINFTAVSTSEAEAALTPGSQPTTPAPAAVAVIRNHSGERPPLQLPRTHYEEVAPLPAASATSPPPTIDDVLGELYERIRLEYLRTYGASGD